jgi:LysM repeat protein
MSASCTQFGVADNSDDEINEISTAIQSVGASTGVDPRFILAIMMQESNGCVRAPTTNYGVRNPGLMQSHNGAGTCNDASVVNPCPVSEVMQMITDGTAGTSSGDGLKQCIAETGATDVSMFYKAARIYNSGSIASTKNLGQGVATHCYASDIANRLTGWSSGPSQCNSDAVEAMTGTVTSNSGSTGGEFAQSAAPAAATTSAAPVATSTAVVVPLPAATSTTAPAPAATTQAAPVPESSAPAAPAPVQPSTPVTPAAPAVPVYPGASSPCSSYYTVVAGDYCLSVASKTGITFATLQSLNPGLDATCSNLWLGYQYCIQA